MKTALVLFCLSCALARESPPESGLYQPRNTQTVANFAHGKEFVYYYDAQVMTGIPRTSSQRSGTRIQAAVLVYPNGNEFTVKLESVKIGSIDQRIPFASQNRILPMDMFDPAVPTSQFRIDVEKPFQITRQDGRITKVKLSDEQPFVKNIKRGVVNMLSADLVGKNNKIKSKYCQKRDGGKDCAAEVAKQLKETDEYAFYSITEETIEGNCKVDYTVVKSSSGAPSAWNITKAIDLNQCVDLPGRPGRPKVAYNFHLSDSCPGCETKDKALNASTVMNIDCFGENRKDCVIERVRSISIYAVPSLTDEPGNTIRTKVNQSLILIDVRQKQAPAAPGLQQFALRYGLEWDQAKEKLQLTGDSDEWRSLKQFAKWGQNKVKVCIDILKQLGSASKAKIFTDPLRMESAGRFKQLVTVIRAMTLSEIDQLHQEAFVASIQGLEAGGDVQAVRDVLHSAIAAAGTLPAVQHINQCITSNKISSHIRIVSALKQLQSARIVSEAILKEMELLCDAVESKPAQYQMCVLAYGSMIRTRCQPKGNQLARKPEKCSHDKRKEYVAFFASPDNLLKDEPAFAKNIALIKGLANTGLTEMAPEVQRIAMNQEYSEELRTQAVLALRTLKEVAPKFISPVCLPIVLNKRMEPSVRVACAHVILRSNPQTPELLTLVAQINRRRDSRIVKSFIYSELSGFANSTGSWKNPCTKMVAERARQVLRLVNDNEKVITSSFSSRMQLYSNKQPYGMQLVMQSLASNESFVPALLAMKVGGSFMGFNVPEILTLAVQSKGLDKVLVNLVRNSLNSHQGSRARRHANLNTEIRQQLDRITSNERLDSDNARLVAYLRVLGQEAGALPVDKTILEWLVKQYKEMSNEQLNQKFSIHLASIFSESMLKLPTAMGLPIVVRTSTPMIFQAKGSLGQHNTEHHYLKDLDLLPTILIKREISVEVVSPVVSSGVKINQRSRLSQPLRLSVTKQNVAEFQTPSHNQDTELITIIAEPVCFRRKWYDSDPSTYVHASGQIITSRQHARTYKIAKEANIFGLKFQLRLQHSQSHVENSASFPLVPATAGPSHLRVTVQSQRGCSKMTFKPNYEPTRMTQGEFASKVHDVKLNPEDPTVEPLRAASHSKKELKLEIKCGQEYYSKVKLAYKASPGSRIRRAEATVESKSGRPYYCAEAEALYPAGPIKSDDLNSRINSRLAYTWGPNCQSNQEERRIVIEMQSEVSEKKKRALRSSEAGEEYRRCLAEESPVECYNILSKQQKPDKHTIVMKYNNVDERVLNQTQKMLAMFTASHISNAYINKYDKSPANSIRAVIRVDPVTNAQQNLTIQEPGQTIRYQDIRSSLLASPNSMVMRLFQPSSYVAQCLVSDRVIKAFDGLRFKAPLTTCWTVIAKDCSPANRFAVLMKNKQGDNTKILGIVTKNRLVEVEKQQDFKITVDSVPKEIPQPTEQMTELAGREIYVQKYSDQKIKVSLPEQEVHVYFDGKAVSVKISAAYFGEQCGLCGHYNRDEHDTMRSRDNQQQQIDVLQFFQSYQLQGDGCPTEPSDPSQYHLGSEPVMVNEQGQLRHNRKSKQPIMLRRGTFLGGQYCVSKQEYKTCPIGTTPVNSQQQTVGFVCIISSDDKTHHLSGKINNQAKIEEDEMPASDVDYDQRISISIPSKCQFY